MTGFARYWVGFGFAVLVASGGTAQAAGTIPVLLETDATNPAQRHLLWQTEPGVRYQLQGSTNLQSTWAPVPGYPRAAGGLTLDHPFVPEGQGFLRIGALDEQPPRVAFQYPAANGFAVGRFASLLVQLDDVSGLAPASVRVTVGGQGPLAPGAPGLVITTNTISYDPGASALGAWGTTVTATVVAADLLGNTLTNAWSFRLETEPLAATNVFVFGSPVAQQAGQRVWGPAAFLAARYPAVPATLEAPASPWSLVLVDSNRVVLAYTNGVAPSFAVGQLICNLVPTRENEIFYRRVVATSNDAANATLTILTEEAALTDFVRQGGVGVSADSVVLTLGTSGTVVNATAIGGTLTFPRIGLDLSGSAIGLREDGFEATVKGVTYSLGDDPKWLEVSLPEYSWWLTPSIRAGLELDWSGLKSFEAIAQGDVAIAEVIEGDVVLLGLSVKREFFDLAGPATALYLGQLGPIPVFATLGLRMGLEGKGEAKAQVEFSTTYRQDHSVAFGVAYERATGLEWVHSCQSTTPDLRGEAALVGELAFHLTFDPRLEFLVYGLAGMKAAIEPSAGVVTTVPLIGGAWDGKIEADVDFVLGAAGPAFEALDYHEELALNLWHGEWPLVTQTLEFRTQPKSQTVAPGADVSFTCTVESPTTPTFQWYRNAVAIPGQINRSLFLPHVSTGHAGAYRVRATAGSLATNSETATLVVQTPTPETRDTDGDGIPDVHETNTGVWASPTDRGTSPTQWDSDGDGLSDGAENSTGVYVSRTNPGTNPNRADTDGDGVNDKREVDLGTDPNALPTPGGMVLIPGGTNAGTDPDFGAYSLTVASFYMDVCEVTKAKWDEVYTWAIANGYGFDSAGSGKAANHPVQTVNWYDCVKWCNARSQKEGRAPVYYTDAGYATVYKTGRVSGAGPPYAKPTAKGYRLPTDVEWQYAARGGAASRRFPWGNMIDHSWANYYSYWGGGVPYYSYDTGYAGYDTRYATGASPYTSPAGAFAANGYGLYDMAGNVWEWCFDWYPGYEGSYRVFRGGGWLGGAYGCRVGNRGTDDPVGAYGGIGFRAVLPPGQ